MNSIAGMTKGTRLAKMGRLACLAIALSVLLQACMGPPRREFTWCVDFESVAFGTEYRFLDSFTDSRVPMTVEAFQWSNGTWTTGNFARADNRQMAGGSGIDMNLNNVNLRLHLGRVGANDLTIAVGEYGGNINMQVNGEFRNFQNFPDIHNTTMGGTQVTVVNGAQNQTGSVNLSGLIRSFSIGGQELWIDDLCS